MTPTPNLLAALWLAWALVWAMAARHTARTVARQAPLSRAFHLTLIALGAALVFVHVRTPAFFAHPLVPNNPAVAWVGFALLVIGLGFALWARVLLGRYWSGTVTLKEDHSIVRRGPYGIVRHPIYSGLLVGLLGTAATNGSVGAALGYGLVMLACGLKIVREEAVLSEHFGAAYRDCCREVRAVIPFLL